MRKTFSEVGYHVSEELIYQIADDYIRYLSKQDHLVSGTIELLDYLYPKYKLHIITNGFHEVQNHKLTNSGLAKYFDVIVNSEMAGVKKPNEKIFNCALEKAEVSIKNSIMIGDSLEADVEGALNFGMDAILFNYHSETGFNDEIKVVNSLLEIKQLL